MHQKIYENLMSIITSLMGLSSELRKALRLDEDISNSSQPDSSSDGSAAPVIRLIKSGSWKDNTYIDNLKQEEKQDFKAAETLKEKNKNMPPKFEDGSFRQKGNTLEYRFMNEEQQTSVCGATKMICWQRRADLMSGKLRKNKKTGKLKKNKKKTQILYLPEYFENYYKTFKIRKNGSKINPTNEDIINNVLKPKFNKFPIKNFTITKAKEFLKEYDDRPNRQKKLYIFLNEVFTMAAAEGVIKNNPMTLIKLEKYEIESFNAIQPKEQNLILKSIERPEYLAFFWYLCCVGLRLDTAMKALNDVDFEENLIKVNKKDTTTKKHKTTIPFLPELINKENIALLKSVKRREAQDYFKNLFNSLGLDLVLHSCRKTFASCAYHVGFSEKWIQDKLCHSTIDMTMNTYVKLVDNEDSPILDYFRRLKSYLKL